MANEKALRTAAKEMNTVMELEPAINTKASVEVLTEKLKEAITFIDAENDEFTESTQAVIDELSAPPAKGKGKAAPKGKAKAAPVEEDDDDDDDAADEDADDEADDEDEDDEQEAPAPKAKGKVAPKGKAKAAPVEEDDDDDEDEEPAPKAIKGKAGKVAPKKKERGPSPYGTSIEICCANPAIKKEDLFKKLTKKGIDIAAGKAGILTAHSVVQKIVSELRKNGLME